jgi:hypothetical protein
MLILCAFSGECVETSSQWYQYIRKMSHLARWSFRSFHKGWKPERDFPWDFDTSSDSASPNNDSQIHDNENPEESAVLHVSAASFVIENDKSPDVIVDDVEPISIRTTALKKQ